MQSTALNASKSNMRQALNGRLFVILHNIRSAYNVGSIFRTADAAGVDKVFLGGYTPTPLSDSKLKNQNLGKVEKTALGAEKVVPWEYCKQTWRLLKKLKKERVQIAALEQHPKAIDYQKFKPSWPMALVLGNEVEGLSQDILKYMDTIIEIPMYGKKESLNVSIAAGVALFKIIE